MSTPEADAAALKCQRAFGNLVVQTMIDTFLTSDVKVRLVGCLTMAALQQWDRNSPKGLLEALDIFLAQEDVTGPVRNAAFYVRSAARTWAMFQTTSRGKAPVEWQDTHLRESLLIDINPKEIVK